MSKYQAEEKAFYAVIEMKGLRPNKPNRRQYIGPYAEARYAKGQVTIHRKLWKTDFIDGWVDVATDFTRLE